nr:hypothetical protein [uncultured Blautia sp.]
MDKRRQKDKWREKLGKGYGDYVVRGDCGSDIGVKKMENFLNVILD